MNLTDYANQLCRAANVPPIADVVEMHSDALSPYNRSCGFYDPNTETIHFYARHIKTEQAKLDLAAVIGRPTSWVFLDVIGETLGWVPKPRDYSSMTLADLIEEARPHDGAQVVFASLNDVRVWRSGGVEHVCACCMGWV